VHSQISAEYRSFASTLRFKKLTDKMLIYLHNSVLLPKIEFRAQTTFINERKCAQLSSPFRSVLKHSLSLPLTFPNVGLFSPHYYGLKPLYSSLCAMWFSTLYSLFNSPRLSSFLSLRLDNLQFALWLANSPLSTDLTKLSCPNRVFNSDILFNMLRYCHPLFLSFRPVKPVVFPIPFTFPLLDIFQSDYSIFAPFLRKYNLLFLSQLITDDGLYLLSWLDLRTLGLVSNRGHVALWYRRLIPLVCASPNSLALLPQFQSPASSVPVRLPNLLPLHDHNAVNWIAHLSAASAGPRTIYKYVSFTFA
jgi:hypothetical protein